MSSKSKSTKLPENIRLYTGRLPGNSRAWTENEIAGLILLARKSLKEDVYKDDFIEYAKSINRTLDAICYKLYRLKIQYKMLSTFTRNDTIRTCNVWSQKHTQELIAFCKKSNEKPVTTEEFKKFCESIDKSTAAIYYKKKQLNIWLYISDKWTVKTNIKTPQPLRKLINNKLVNQTYDTHDFALKAGSWPENARFEDNEDIAKKYEQRLSIRPPKYVPHTTVGRVSLYGSNAVYEDKFSSF